MHNLKCLSFFTILTNDLFKYYKLVSDFEKIVFLDPIPLLLLFIKTTDIFSNYNSEIFTKNSDGFFRTATSASVHGRHRRLKSHVGVVQQPRGFSRPRWRMRMKMASNVMLLWMLMLLIRL